MIISQDYRPTPSDFGDFVYCSRKWTMKHNKATKEKHVDNALSQGKKNEHKCIDWVCNKYKITEKQILFNGTGENNYNCLTSNIELVNMNCQPDLIINVYNKNILFEFKAVSKPEYLDLHEFDSVDAQVWCYTKLKEFKIDEYRLLRYFIDPFAYFDNPIPRRFTNKAYEEKIIHFFDFVSCRFEEHFKKYIKTIELFKLEDDIIKRRIITDPIFTFLQQLPNEKEKKCYYCSEKRKVCDALNIQSAW